MNKTITSILTNTANNEIRNNAAKLISWAGKKVKAVFTKKDGSLRTMIFCPSNNWNEMNGIVGLTNSGKKMVETKIANGVATVTEFLADGTFRPRSLNLSKIISMELV